MYPVKLISDFHDYYDHFFDNSSEMVFHRKTTTGPNRFEMFKLLNMVGFPTPKYGIVSEIRKELIDKFDGGEEQFNEMKYDEFVEVVVYTDIRAHAGDGKVKTTLKEANEKYPECLAAQFIPTPGNSSSYKSRSERLLVVGDRICYMEFLSSDDWRSNCGEVTMNKTYMPVFGNGISGIKIPLYAIDFVVNGKERFAVDFNTAPGIKGTPAEDMLSPQDVAAQIKKVIYELNR